MSEVRRISEKGIEELKSILWAVDYLQKIGIVTEKNGDYYLLVEYKLPTMTSKGLTHELKTVKLK